MADLRNRTFRFVLVDLAVLLFSLLIAFMLSVRLQRAISDPIRALAMTASTVSVHENYSIRAVKRNQDEIGMLFDQFNSMLARIQQRDVAIQKAHDELEKRVSERTAYLNALIENSPARHHGAGSATKRFSCAIPLSKSCFNIPRPKFLATTLTRC